MPTTIEERIARLESSLGERDKSGKWVSIAGSILVPLAIGVAGLMVSRAIAARENEVAKINARVQQVDVATKLFDALVSTDARKRTLAAKALLIAMPDEGPDLVADVSRSDPDSVVREQVSLSLETRIDALIADLFAGSAAVRIAAADKLASGWSSNPKIVPQLISYAHQHWDNDNGVYNTAAVLATLSPAALTPNKALLEPFLDRASRKGRRTAGQVNRIRQLIG